MYYLTGVLIKKIFRANKGKKQAEKYKTKQNNTLQVEKSADTLLLIVLQLHTQTHTHNPNI